MARAIGKVPRRNVRSFRMKIAVGLSLAIILGTFLYFAYWPQGGNAGQTVVIDWRMKLSIHDSSLQRNLTIPANIGVLGGPWFDHSMDSYGPKGYAPLSTRDTSGIIYIQATSCCPVFRFGDFFRIWGQTYNGTCVVAPDRGLYCGGPEDDPNIRYVDLDGSGFWNNGEPVVYDSNGSGVYDSGDRVLLGTAPRAGTPLIDDPLMFYADTTNYGTWDPAVEPVVHDSNGNGLYDGSDLRITFVDVNNDGIWTPGESVIYDTNSTRTFDLGEPVIAGSPPAAGTALKVDLRVRYIDANDNSKWDSGESVVYDVNNDSIYDVGEPVIAGTAPSARASLKGEAVIAGTAPPTGWMLIRPPPFMSDGDLERCLDRGVGLSDGKDWIILIWSTLGVAKCSVTTG